LHEGIILTEGEESRETISVDGNNYTIHVIAVWKWLLKN
jgi:hypothetical protein